MTGLGDRLGDYAPIMAPRCAEQEQRAGNDHLAGVWDTVREATRLLIGTLPAPACATIH